MEYQFSFNQRLVSQTFTKFRDTFTAFCELVNNSIQAKAKEIRIYIDENPPELLTKTKFNQIIIRDNGLGVSKSDFKKKLLEIATDVKDHGQGLGRFAALQLGAKIRIETVAYDQVDEVFCRSFFELSTNDLEKSKYLEKIKLSVEHTKLQGKTDTYYEVKITDLYDDSVTRNEPHKKASKSFLTENIASALFARYPEEIYNDVVVFFINNDPIQPRDYVIGEPEFEKSEFTDLDGIKHNFNFNFIKVKSTNAKQRIFIRANNNNLKSVAHSFNHKADIPEQNDWFIYIDSLYFDERTDIFRNFQITDLDEAASHVISEIQSTVDIFFVKKYKKYKSFVERLKGDKHYPYRIVPPSSSSKGMIFNQIAFYVEKEHKILLNDNKLRELIYPLIDKALNQGELQVLLSEIIKLDTATVAQFANLLAKVDLDDIIQFSEEVSSKNQFLDFLYEILYGKPARHVKERSQLHKIIERKLWLFGEQYNNNATKLYSDKNLGRALDELRERFLVYEPSAKDENLVEIEDDAIRNITDLFFYSEKILNDEVNEVMIVELKAPKVKINQKELNQVDKYAFDIMSRDVFPKNLKYKIFLLGSQISDFAKNKLGKIEPKNPFLYEKPHDCIDIYVMNWSELLQHHRKRLSYLGNILKSKDSDVKDIFESEFNDINLHEKLKSIIS